MWMCGSTELFINVIVTKITSLKSLRLRKLLDQSTFAYWVLLDLTGPYWASLGLTWPILGLTGPYWALLGLTGPLLGLTGPYLALQGALLHLLTN